MANMILLGEGGSINPERVTMVASAKSAPIKRLLKTIEPHRVIDLTYGYPRESVLVMDTGMLAITSYPIEKITYAIRIGKEVNPDEPIPF